MAKMMGLDFRPSDEDIIGFFLMRLFTVGPPLPSMVCDSIHDIDIYGEAPPWEIAAQLPESQRHDFYVFAMLKKRSANRKLRTASNGKGTWKGQSTGKKIVAGSLVGQKKTFCFMADDSEKKKRVTSHWNMTEYSVLEMDGREIGEGYAICHVTRSNRSSGNNNVAKRKAGVQESDGTKIKRVCRRTKKVQELSPKPPALAVVAPNLDAEFGIGFLLSDQQSYSSADQLSTFVAMPALDENNECPGQPLYSQNLGGEGFLESDQLSSSPADQLSTFALDENNEWTRQPLDSQNLGGQFDGWFFESEHLGPDGSSSSPAGDGADPLHELSSFAATALEDEEEEETQSNESTWEPLDFLTLSGFVDADVSSGDQYHQLSVSGDAYMGSDKNAKAGGLLSDPQVQHFDSSDECCFDFEYLFYDLAATVEAELDCLEQQGLSFFTDAAAAAAANNW